MALQTKDILRILAVGDVVGVGAVDFLERRLHRLRDKLHADLVVVNAENAAEGNGLDPQVAERVFAAGADVITGGNHTFQKRSIYDYFDIHPALLRPANYPADAPGDGCVIVPVRDRRALVINISGVVFMEPLENPFETVERILARHAGAYDFALMDIHAEATAEKLALARYFDGRIHCIWGTHTHVQTADEQILPQHSGYITDLGMTGAAVSILGVESQLVIQKFRSKLPVRFRTVQDNIVLHGALFDLDARSGAVTKVQRVVQADENDDIPNTFD